MSSSKAAAVMGGKAARACDSCLRRRARWYCAADDAFLCQACDASVHSANPLARRHERLRMRPTPSSPLGQAGAASTTSNSKPGRQVAPAAWSKRKARTRRPHVKSVGQLLSRKLVEVPEVGAAAESSEELKAEEDNGSEEEQLLYRVPSFDRALAELCSPPPSSSSFSRDRVDGAVDIANNKDSSQVVATTSSPVQQLPDHVAGFGPTDAELREFAADMEALLGQGLDDGNEADECFYMESLGLTKRPPAAEDGGWVKMEHDGTINNNSHQKGSLLGFAARHADQLKSEAPPADVLGIHFNNSCSPTAVDDEDDEREDSSEQKGTASNNGEDAAADAQFLRGSLDLRLNYEAVIESWGNSPWTDGQRPDGVQLDDFWPHPGMWPPAGGGRPGTGEPLTPRWGADGGREARVSRYREKRRTRLFAKKIRYEVRKLNAEKRPRMKGRFVKRPPSAGGGAAVAAAVT